MKSQALYFNNGTSVFNRFYTSDLVFEPCDGDVLIKDIDSGAYLYVDLSKPRDDKVYGVSYYVGARMDKNNATRFTRVDK